MNAFIKDLAENEERLSILVIGGAVAVVGIGFVIALIAIFTMG